MEKKKDNNNNANTHTPQLPLFCKGGALPAGYFVILSTWNLKYLIYIKLFQVINIWSIKPIITNNEKWLKIDFHFQKVFNFVVAN